MAEKPQLSIVSYTQGTYIIVEGNRDASKFFIIQRGKVLVTGMNMDTESGDARTLGPGDFFGILAAMSGHTQVETAQAITDTLLVSVNVQQFEGLIQYNTPIAMKIIQQFSRRVRQLNNALAELTTKGENKDDDPEILFRNAQYYAAKKDFLKAFYCYRRYIECYPQAEHKQNALVQLKELQQYNKIGWTSIPGNDFQRKYPKNTLICAEGEVGKEMYIIQSGRANIIRVVNGAEIVLAVLKPGDMFGEMSLLESKPRSAGAVALEDCTVLTVSKENFETMTATKPQLIARLTQNLAGRIWFSYKQLANARMSDPTARFFDTLYMHLEKEKVNFAPHTSYVFNLGFDQLLQMANVPPTEKRHIMRAIEDNKAFKLVSDKIMTSDVIEIVKLSDFYKKQYARTHKK
ncbi:MAG: cyclic nucleotide-binding domain-containing protein [Spirochaetaceae bacterium]|jgi:CRP-like cAMP-binding protein|nr:cyclic nucleotide-binding domain-containing protein [Spirochaetaceae bacterium]